MKKLLLSFVFMLPILAFTGCSKDSDDTTYVFKFSMEDSETFKYTVFLHEYNNSNEKVNSFSIDAYNGFAQEFTANPNAERIKLLFRISSGTYSTSGWIQQVYYLKKGGKVEIELTGKELIGSDEP